jgi:dTDP-4-amino-4,6-dideoxygalactose transaminase
MRPYSTNKRFIAPKRVSVPNSQNTFHPQFATRAEITWEKGTNRSAFFRGEVDKYGWVDVGSSSLPSESIAAFLWAQLENILDIQFRRMEIWKGYQKGLSDWASHNSIKIPSMPTYASNNAHMVYLVCQNLEQRTDLIQHLKALGILSVFHYLSLHSSPFYKDKHNSRQMPESDRYSECLVRLPMFYELDYKKVVKAITEKNIELVKI